MNYKTWNQCFVECRQTVAERARNHQTEPVAHATEQGTYPEKGWF